MPEMDSEMLWDILKFPNFEYYPASCSILEYGAGNDMKKKITIQLIGNYYLHFYFSIYEDTYFSISTKFKN